MGEEYYILSDIFSHNFPRSQDNISDLVQPVCVKCVQVFMTCFVFQAWREQYGAQGTTGRGRAGYTDLEDNQASPVTENKKSGRVSQKAP